MGIILSEGKRDEALSIFLPLLRKRGIEMSVSQLKQFLLNKFVTEAGIRSLSEGSNYYLLGVARCYFAGELTSNKRLNILYPQYKDKFISDVCHKLDIIIGILRGRYIDSVGTKFELPEDFGGLSVDALFKKYGKLISKSVDGDDAGKSKTSVVTDSRVGRGYSYEILYSFDDAKKYKEWTEPGAWCITYGKQHYDYYVSKLGIHYVIFRMNGFEKVRRRKGVGWSPSKPQDDYGNSLIALLQSNRTGEPVYITSRWNHGSRSDNSMCEADHAYTKEEFFAVTGCNDAMLRKIQDEWRANSGRASKNRASYEKKLGVLRAFKYCQMLINGGGDVKSLLRIDCVMDDKKGMSGTYIVYLDIGGEIWYTLMDRKKLYYDVFLSKDRYDYVLQGDSCISLADERGRYCFFDRKRHSFADLDGKVRFNHINGGAVYDDSGADRYCVVAMSGNQVALFDFSTMRPVRARNGSCWFESINRLGNTIGNSSARGVSLPYRVDNTLLYMVYDSSADESYVYNTGKGSFIRTEFDDGFKLSRYQSYRNNGLLLYVKAMGNGNGALMKVLHIGTQSGWLTINGKGVFKELNIDDENVVGYKALGDEVAHYVDLTSGRMLMIDGKPIETTDVSMSSCGNYLAISFSKGKTLLSGNFWDDVVLFNPVNRTFFHDRISGWHFHVYGAIGKVRVYYPNDVRYRYELPSAHEAARMSEMEKDSVSDGFRDMVGRMGR